MLEFDDHGRDQQQASDAVIEGGGSEPRDSVTTRRALLTGGALVAGAAVATVAATEQASAATFVVLGGNNNETTPTVIRSTASRAIVAQCTVANAAAVAGRTDTSGGTGLFGAANSASTNQGVWGVSDKGVGVKGQSDDNYGVHGTGGYIGVYGSGGSYGGYFYGNSAYGVYAYGSAYGTYGSASSYGAVGTASGSSGYGVYGTGYLGVYGYGSSYGVYGTSSSGYGVYGSSGYLGVYGTGSAYGGYFAASNASNGRAVEGAGSYLGVAGEAPRYGVYGNAYASSGLCYGVYGTAPSNGWAVFASGDCRVTGLLSKAAGSFQIDHPLDPDHKWLRHSFVESPDMMNVYNGNVVTDASGLAWVKLPAYFAALNRDFRYQLTVIGKFAQAIVDREVSNNQFRIRTDQGNVKVSWLVTGIRQDDFAKAHPIVVEEAKKAGEAGARQFVPKDSAARLMSVGPSGGPGVVSLELPKADVAPPQALP